MGKISTGIAGAVGVLVGIVLGILLAPRSGSETREEIVRRYRPLQQAAKRAASQAGDALKPVTRMAGERVPLIGERVSLIGNDKEGDKLEELAGESIDDDSPTSEGREDGKTASRGARTEKVGSRS